MWLIIKCHHAISKVQITFCPAKSQRCFSLAINVNVKHVKEASSCAWPWANLLIKMIHVLTKRRFHKPHTSPHSPASIAAGCSTLDNSFQMVIDCLWGIYKHLYSLYAWSWTQHCISSEKLRIYVCIAVVVSSEFFICDINSYRQQPWESYEAVQLANFSPHYT